MKGAKEVCVFKMYMNLTKLNLNTASSGSLCVSLLLLVDSVAELCVAAPAVAVAS